MTPTTTQYDALLTALTKADTLARLLGHTCEVAPPDRDTVECVADMLLEVLGQARAAAGLG